MFAGRWYRWLFAIWLLSTGSAVYSAEELPPSQQFLAFIREQARTLREQDRPPATKEEWLARREQLQSRLEQAWGGFPTSDAVPETKLLGALQRDGYRIEKLLINTLPEVWMTALAYVPDSPGKHPAILSVHGHWKHAKVEPALQSRAIGAAKLGFFVLAVDAFGAGERAIGEELGEYHGEMVAATLFPIGRPLSGIQVFENMRAVDYLQSRPEVEPTKIGITGASGGGNQTMYAGAFDDRLGAVVPVCSVGNYQAYLGAACCMCEVVPGALTFTEESGILGMVAPRALMPCNVTRDAHQFSIREARKSILGAQEIFNLLGTPDSLYHSTFRWNHDYHQPIREAMYGWMTQFLKGEGDGTPIPEPAHTPEPPEELRLFPGTSRPDDWFTLPQFAAREAQKLLSAHEWPATAEGQPDLAAVRAKLIQQTFGGFPSAIETAPVLHFQADQPQQLAFDAEPGITLKLRSAMPQPVDFSKAPAGDVVLLLNLKGAATATQSPFVAALQARGATVVTLDLRATGEFAVPGEVIGRAPDHNSAEWSMWIGRPLLGQWTVDTLQAVRALQAQWPSAESRRYHLVGEGPAGLVALSTGAVTTQFTSVTAVEPLASYVTAVPYTGQYLGTLAPGLLRDIGDVPHLAALALPQRVIVAGGVAGSGSKLTAEELTQAFTLTEKVAKQLDQQEQWRLLTSIEADQIAQSILP